MCYTAGMERIAIRELRNQVSRVVRRAHAGERLIITVDGVPAAGKQVSSGPSRNV